jgi:hypothetical protein
MNRQEVIENLQDLSDKTCQVYVRYIDAKLTIYTIKTLLKFNGDSFSIIDKEGSEVVIPYHAVERIIKKNRVDLNGQRN